MEGKKMLKSLKRLAAAFLIAVFIFGSLSVTNVEAATLKAPKNLRFSSCKYLTKNQKVTSFTCKVKWDKVSGANAYEVKCTWTDSSHKIGGILYGKDQKGATISGINPAHVYRCQVRALKVDSSKKIKTYGKWSTSLYITPWPMDVKGSLSGSKNVKLRWNTIYGCNGYSVYLSTNPSKKWYKNFTTSHKCSATSGTVKKFRGSSLQKYQNYYVRVKTLRKFDGEYRTIPAPSSGFWSYRFYLYNKY